MSLLSLRSVEHRYHSDGPQTLRGLDLEVQCGEFLALLGPSGCGKSTLLRILAGHEDFGGEMVFDNKTMAFNNPKPERRGFSMVFQDGALFPHLKVAANIAFGLGKLPKATVQEKVRELATLLKVEGTLDRYPHELSGGQRQRVAIARSLVTEPRLLLLDEPLSSLDAQLRMSLGREIRELVKRQNLTAIMVSHDQREAFAMADRVAVMRAGDLEQIARPREIYNDPATAFVAEFVGQGAFLGLESSSPSSPKGFVRPEWLRFDEAGELKARVEAIVDGGPRPELLLNFEQGGRLNWTCPEGCHVDEGQRLSFSLERTPLVW